MLASTLTGQPSNEKIEERGATRPSAARKAKSLAEMIRDAIQENESQTDR